MPNLLEMADPDKIELRVPALKVQQPIGDMYIASLDHRRLQQISHFDVRRVIQEQRDVEKYLGIQRPLIERRVAELQRYVNFVDAAFPSSIILAISDEYIEFEEGHLLIRNYRADEDSPSIMISTVARVLDGQHRIAGLEKFSGEHFDVSITIFIGSDLADQAYIFATVNLEQTKVSRSLAYDLFELAKSRSPQKVCHNIAVTLDRDVESPFYKKIKRLGVTTPGRSTETLTQAAFVEGIMSLISKSPKDDRDSLLRGQRPSDYKDGDYERFVLRKLFLDEKDMVLTATINNFFSVARDRWPEAWASNAKGYILNRTAGFRALIRMLRKVYLREAGAGHLLKTEQCVPYFRRIDRDWQHFNTDNYKPGSTGESDLYRMLERESGLN